MLWPHDPKTRARRNVAVVFGKLMFVLVVEGTKLPQCDILRSREPKAWARRNVAVIFSELDAPFRQIE